MSQSQHYSWAGPALHGESGLCTLCGRCPCVCAPLYLDPTRHFENSSIINRFPAYQQPTIASWDDVNWDQSGSPAQVPFPRSSQYNASVGYNPAHPLSMRVLGTEHGSMHGASDGFAAIPYPPVQENASPANTGHAPTEEGSIYYGSPVEQHITQDARCALPCFWGPKHGSFPNIASLLNHLKRDHIDPQCQAHKVDVSGKMKCHWEEGEEVGCTATFSDKGSLNRHVQSIHVNRKSFFCPFCKKICNREDNLEGHLSGYHRVSVWWRRCRGECYQP